MESTVLALKSSWMQRQAEPSQCEDVPDVSDISQHQRCQSLVINGDIKMTRVGGSDNCADVGTMKFCGIRFAEGRSRIAPQLEHLSTIDCDEHCTGGSPQLRYSTA